MNKKYFIASGLMTLLCLPLASCGGNQPAHQHAFYPVIAKDATCIAAGNIAYEQCIYCKEIRVDGKVKTLEEVTLPINPHNHLNAVSVEAKAETCSNPGIKAHSYCSDCKKFFIGEEFVEEESLTIPADPTKHVLVHSDLVEATCLNGMKAHDKCSECGKYFINGTEVSEESLILPADKDHTFTDGDLCSVCKDAYRTKDKTGTYQYLTNNENLKLESVSKGAAHTAEHKTEFFPLINKERMHFATQHNGNSKVKVIENGIEISASKGEAQFTRFCLGFDGKAYTGRVLLSFSLTTNKDIIPNRVGLKVCDNAAKIISGSGIVQDKLLGSKSTEENNPDRILKAGVAYRFIYDVTTSSEDQIVQLFTDMPYSIVSELTDFRIKKLESTTSGVNSTLLYFGKQDMLENTK